MILLQSAPMTVHNVAATICFPSSLSSLDLRSVESFQFSATFPLMDIGDGAGI